MWLWQRGCSRGCPGTRAEVMCLHEAAAVLEADVPKELRPETCYQIAACVTHCSLKGSGGLRSCSGAWHVNDMFVIVF